MAAPRDPTRTGGALRGRTGHGPLIALARRSFRDARTRMIAFAYLFGLYGYAQAVGYRHAYPTLADRLAFVHGFAGNSALRLFYGFPYDAVTVSGYCAWRVGGTLAIAAAVFGVLAAVRAERTEEDAGRMELVLAGIAGRRTAYLAGIGAIVAGTTILWAAEFAGFLAGGLPAGGSAYLALASASVVPVFAGVGALASQLAPTRRMALELGTAVVGVSLLLRAVADTSAGAGWLRWLTPLGWAEETRPFAGDRPAVLLLPVALGGLSLYCAGRIAAGRDIGTGLLPSRESSAPRMRLLGSASAQALRGARGTLLVWLASTGSFALILGMVSTSVSSAGISQSLQRELSKLGGGSITTPAGYLSFVFIFFILVVSLFACAQVGAARQEEEGEQLETLLSQPIGRHRWLGGRLALAAAAAAVLSAAIGLLAWAGAASQGVSISLPRMLEAGANCLPVAILFLGLAGLAYALAPRASGGIAYALVAASFLWQLVGSLLGGPSWLLKLTPFAHVGFVPAQAFRGLDALVMLAIGAACGLAALGLFRRRDLLGA